jgi:predicted ATPase
MALDRINSVVPFYLSYLASAYAELGQFNDAWRCISEAMTAVETTQERWWEAEVNRTAGEIALLSPEPDAAKAEKHFEHALAVARQQQAKSLKLRAAMSLARFWRPGQGRQNQMRRKRKSISSTHSRSRVSSKQSP